MTTLAWSYGGGWQSVATGVLIGQGKLPKPDLAGIADTSREVGTTWEYLYGVMQPYLDRTCGVKIEVVPHSLARVDLYANDGGTLVPAYTRTEDVMGLFGEQLYKGGRLDTYCSGEWKRDVMMRWYRLKGVESCVQMIGYSLDEAWRAKPARKKWCQPDYPLIRMGITRQMCGEIIEAAGLPMPWKSRCWCCPHQSPEEWREVQSRPEEFAAAVALEKEINERDPDHGGELFLYSGRVPLELATFSEKSDLAARPCADGHCWT